MQNVIKGPAVLGGWEYRVEEFSKDGHVYVRFQERFVGQGPWEEVTYFPMAAWKALLKPSEAFKGFRDNLILMKDWRHEAPRGS